jgi:glucosamine--fructose-6-phosphate aminotransferase (isomerizing)
MCGIVGSVSHRHICSVLVEGLRRLEYRGYDSAGVAVLDADGKLLRARETGKIRELEQNLAVQPIDGKTGIAHTRWATHGVPAERNAHPHVCGGVAAVHNGIIENHEALRIEYQAKGYSFSSDTDTEVAVVMIHDYMQQGAGLFDAVRQTIVRLQGAYALGVICEAEPHRMVAARHGSPLVVGLGEDENFIASDIYALVGETQRFIFLDDGDMADLTPDNVQVYGQDGQAVQRTATESRMTLDAVERGEYRHYMLKEIFEQPLALEKTLDGRLASGRVLDSAFGQAAAAAFDAIQAVQIVACGTSFHAGSVARYWLESLANLPCNVEVASEFRYRKQVVRPGTLFVTISQSGETADTLAALKEAKRLGYAHTLAICNVAQSSIVRDSDSALLTRAGMEIGVASTKAFTTQLAALLMLVLALGRRNGLGADKEAAIVAQMQALPKQVAEALRLDAKIEQWAAHFGEKHHALYLGRGSQYPVAMEGALKLKEISYIHAEAYAAGELKHGPLALIDNDMPVIAVAPNDELLDKLKSNLQEVQARGGELYVLADAAVDFTGSERVHVLRVGKAADVVAPIVFSVPLQLLAYHVAVIKGTDVDQPRNLAKSVTVE